MDPKNPPHAASNLDASSFHPSATPGKMGDSREDAVKGAIGYPYSLHFHTKYGAKELVTVSQPHDGLMNIGM